MVIKTLSIGQLAARTGLSVSAIRFYETKGLVKAERNAGGQRRFCKADIRRLSIVIVAQKFGFSLERIHELLASLPEEKVPDARDWRKLAGALRDELETRIETLEKLRDNLNGCIGCGCLSLKTCKLYNPNDKASRFGPGPRYLMGDRP